MVDDSQYIIVPNTEQAGHNTQGDLIAKLITQGYRIIAKQSCRDVCHYVLIQFKPRTRPARAGDQTPEHPTNPDIDLDSVNF